MNLETFVARLEKHFNTWSTGISSGSFDDPLSKKSDEEKAFLVGKIGKKLNELRQALQSTENGVLGDEIAAHSSQGSDGDLEETVVNSDAVKNLTPEDKREDVFEPK